MSKTLEPGEALFRVLSQAVELSHWKLRRDLLRDCKMSPTKRAALTTVNCFDPGRFYYADLSCGIEAVWLGEKRLAVIFTITNELPGNVLETLSLDITDTSIPVKQHWISLLRCMVVSHPEMLNNIHREDTHFNTSNIYSFDETTPVTYDEDSRAIWDELTPCVIETPWEEE